MDATPKIVPEIESSSPAIHISENWYSVPELRLHDHRFTVPLDYSLNQSTSTKISVFAHEVILACHYCTDHSDSLLMFQDESLSDGLRKLASALVGNPLKTYQRGGGVGSALASVVGATPSAAIAPASVAVRVVHCVLLGVKNSLDPEHKKESMEKYLGPAQPPEHN